MQTVFVSYSHGDAAFVERLIADLENSDVQARYDKWILNVGDSILSKLAEEVSAADNVIAVLSSRSVQSVWVRKELALAMANEMSSSRVKVLPALIEDCALPDMLIDKVYADFRVEYYYGLYDILRALQPEARQENRFGVAFPGSAEAQAGKQELLRLLNRGDLDGIRTWLERNIFIFKGVLGPVWIEFHGIPHMELGDGHADLVIINGQSGRYDISLILFGPPNLEHIRDLDAMATRLAAAVRWCRENSSTFRGMLAVKVRNKYDAYRIISSSRLNISGKIVVGRRSAFGSDENKLRHEIYEASGRDIDVMSYDRLIDAHDRMLTRPSIHDE